jgi:hypothetical protein
LDQEQANGSEEQAIIIDEGPRKRGRPRKAQAAPETARAAEEGASQTARDVDHEVEVIQEEPRRRGRKPGVSTRAKPEDVAQAAPLMVVMLNNAVVVWTGPECSMTQQEQGILTPSVARMLARLPRSAASAVSAYTDPFVVLLTLGLWARRIASIQQDKKRAAYYQGPVQEARAGGLSGSELLVEDIPDTENVVPFKQDERASQQVQSAILATTSPA